MAFAAPQPALLTGATASPSATTAARPDPGALPTADGSIRDLRGESARDPGPGWRGTAQAPQASAPTPAPRPQCPRRDRGPTVAVWHARPEGRRQLPKVVASPATGASTATTQRWLGARGDALSGGSTSSYAAAGAALGLAPSAAAVYSAIRSTSESPISAATGRVTGATTAPATRLMWMIHQCRAGQTPCSAAYAIASLGRLNIKYHLAAAVWMSSGWRLMEDRGSITQNHFDHKNISVNWIP